MSTKTTAKRPDGLHSETVSKRATVPGGKTLPAVSPVQQKKIESKAEPVQKQAAEDEEALQGKFDPVQRQGIEEEEPMQGKFDPIQKQGIEEEEPMQGKFDPVQRQGIKEEEPMQGKFDPVQRQGIEEEEPMQGKFDPVQRQGIEEEEPMQGKFDPVQRQGIEEEEPMQGKFDPVQRQGIEEEEPMQGKFDPVQRQGAEDEEALQGKFDPVQKQGIEEEEPVQGKFDPVQRQGAEDEEALQGKFDPIQKQGIEEEEPMQGKFDPVQKKTTPSTVQLEDGDATAPVVKTENKTGLSDDLKSGIENISGVSVDDVKVHYNSDKPAQLQALAYAQGTDIHVSPGQEKHIPHEAWHVVQQKQGRVKPTVQMKQGVPVNDDAGLENEADVMGAQALQKGNEIAQAKPLQKKSIDGTGVVQRAFGEDFDHVREENPELNPGLSMVKGGADLAGLGVEGAKGSLGLAGKGISKSGELAAMPYNWAKKKMAGTTSRWKKFGYGALGAVGSLFSGAAGLVGAAGSAVAGGVGAVGSAVGGAVGGLATAAVGGVATGLGGIVTGGKALGRKIKGVNVQEELGTYGPGARGLRLGDRTGLTDEPENAFNADGTRVNYGATSGSELASYGMMGASGAASAARSLTDYSQMMHNGGVPMITGQSIANPDTGFASHGLSGSAEAFGGLGAASGIIGAASAVKDSVTAGREAADGSRRTGERVASGMQSASSLADATKASAGAAWNIATLIDAKGAAAAGAQIAAGGAGIAMGAIDMIRGGYGIWKAEDRKKVLAEILKNPPNEEVKRMAMEAMASQDREKTKAIGNLAKGAITIVGGALLVASMATPIGWALLGGAAIVGGLFALYNYRQKGKQKKEVVMREMGIDPEERKAIKAERKAEVEKIESETGYFSKERKRRLAELDVQKPDPLKAVLKEKGFKSVGHCYANYINMSANQIYTEGVVRGDATYLSLLEGMGLKVDTKDPENPQPTAAKIAKALSV